ncbi:MAG: hypothetical protein HQ525_05910 [Anaerolineae bacterium]|nr:hypothetical protein [Anaerolineae bacterium]
MGFSAFIKRHIPSLFVFVKGLRLVYVSHSYLVTSGLVESYRRGFPCKSDGSPVPWMNYNVISFLEERLTKNLKLLEFGSGYSTLFFTNHIDDVTSIEGNQQWYETTRDMVGKRAKLIYMAPDDNLNEILSNLNEGYDIIVIDGRDRVKCAIGVCDILSDQGVIIFDDSMREEYREGIDYLLDRGFKKIDFEGLKPTSIKFYRTTIFYRHNNCLGI